MTAYDLATQQMLERHCPSLKHRVRSCLDRLAAATGLLTWCEWRMRQGLTILMYHRVLPFERCAEYPLESLVVPVEVFRAQMQWLAAHCRVLPVREAVVELEGGGPFERPLVAVTFDDGYADNFELAAPILEKNDLCGTFFVSSGFVEEGGPLWFDRAADAWRCVSVANRKALMDQLQNGWGPQDLNGAQVLGIQAWMAGLKRAEPKVRMELVHRAESLAEGAIGSDSYSPMTRDQVVALHKREHEIASHTVTHPILPQLDDDKLRGELERSAERLREWTGDSIVGFCYPNGDLDNRVERAVAEVGYSYACTMRTGLNQPGVRPTRLARLSITMQRTVSTGYEHDPLGFRSELCRFREWWR